jgi:Delta7-sterol 5-desaturase
MRPLTEQFGVLPAWAIIAVFAFARYALMAGGIYLVFYIWQKARFQRQKIQTKAPQQRQVLAEIRHSFYSTLIFAVVATGIAVARQFGYTKQYLHISDYGVPYLIGSIGLLVLLHDAYFYWMHRAMHSPRLYRLLHRVHHESVNPTPLAAFSFHPLEALLEFGWILPLALVLPIHQTAFLFLSLWSMVWNIVGHLGYELFPAGFTRHWFWGWFNTSTHHNMHHQRVSSNYGLYFNIWDRLMDTNHPQYLATFDSVKARQD